MNIAVLLTQVTGISKKYDLINQKTGGYFNVFEIANIEYDEVAVCRVLCEFLNPQGIHGQGTTYLRLFLEHVLLLEPDSTKLDRARVYREYRIANDRRIDIAISLGEMFIPIEVKLYARDQINQCYSYHRAARKSDVYYLTLDGHLPTPESAGELPARVENAERVGYEGIRLISFEKDIMLWLDKCLEDHETMRIAPIRETLFQLSATVRKLTNQIDRGMQMDIVQTLTASKESMQSAVKIGESLKAARVFMIAKLFETIEDRLKTQLKMEKLQDQYDYAYKNYEKVNGYYDRKGTTNPGISYFAKPSIKTGVDLWLRIEIQDRLFLGFCTPLNGHFAGEQLNDEEVNKFINRLDEDACIEGWWAYWEYLPEDDEKLAPDFKYFNDVYYDLFDESKFQIFIEAVIKKVDAMRKRLR